MDFRLTGFSLREGAVPVLLISEMANEIRNIVGYAALRLIQDGTSKQRIPKSLYEELDLRVSGVTPNLESVHLTIIGNSKRDLLDDSLVKNSLERIFSVLNTNGGISFLDYIAELGSLSAKHIKKLLSLMQSYSIEVEFTWWFLGKKINFWKGNKENIEGLYSALEVTDVVEQDDLILIGKIGALNKRKRIILECEENGNVSIFYSKIMFSKISKFRLNDEVTLKCHLTKIENRITNEVSVTYELLEIKN